MGLDVSSWPRTEATRALSTLSACLLALVVAIFATTVPARAQPLPAVGPIVVDTGPLRALGVRDYADILEDALGRALEARFADRRARGGARLVVRLDGFFLATYTGPEGGDDWPFGRGFGGGFTPLDELSGEAVLVVDGAVLAREPLRVTLPADQAGAWYLPDNEPRRAVLLAEAYASWLARRL